jgi:transketolase
MGEENLAITKRRWLALREPFACRTRFSKRPPNTGHGHARGDQWHEKLAKYFEAYPEMKEKWETYLI